MKVHVYRNREDDDRRRSEMHFCTSCKGWYGVPHESSHCQKQVALLNPSQCACRFCREISKKPIEGTYGFFTDEPEWQPGLDR